MICDQERFRSVCTDMKADLCWLPYGQSKPHRRLKWVTYLVLVLLMGKYIHFHATVLKCCFFCFGIYLCLQLLAEFVVHRPLLKKQVLLPGIMIWCLLIWFSFLLHAFTMQTTSGKVVLSYLFQVFRDWLCMPKPLQHSPKYDCSYNLDIHPQSCKQDCIPMRTK